MGNWTIRQFVNSAMCFMLLVMSFAVQGQVVEKGNSNEVWKIKGGYEFVRYLSVPRKFNKITGADTVVQIWADSAGHLYVYDSLTGRGNMLLGIDDSDLIQSYAVSGNDAQQLSISNDTVFLENGGYVVLPAGLNGVDGTMWYTASGVPSGGTGVDGDLYLRTANGDVYKKTSGSWGVIANITGPEGPAGSTGPTGATGAAGSNGTNGTNGTNGVDGATWLTGSGAPSGGADDDLYLRTSNGDVYKRVSGSWGVIGNITGPTGPQGATGATGAAGSNGSNGSNGADGADGVDGAIWYTGSGAPGGGTGVDNDLYFNTANGDVYVKVSGSWGSPIANIKGPTGATGATGSTGATGAAGPNTVTTSTSTNMTGIFAGDGVNVKVATVSDFPTFNQNTTGNAGTATVLATARAIFGKSFNGSADVTGIAVTEGVNLKGSTSGTVNILPAAAVTSYTWIPPSSIAASTGMVMVVTAISSGTVTTQFVDISASYAGIAGVSTTFLIPQLSVNNQTGTSYTTVLSDAGKWVTSNNASAVTFTIPPNSNVAYPVNSYISFGNYGAGKLTVAPGSGVTINGTDANRSFVQYADGYIRKTGTDTWVIGGKTSN